MSAHKFVTVPTPIQVGGKPYSLKEFVVYLTENEDHFIKSMRGINAGGRLREAFDKDEPGEVVKLHPEDWQPLRDAADAPSCGYPTWIGKNTVTGQASILHSAPHIAPLGNAILNAADKAPESAVKHAPAQAIAEA